MSTFVSTLIAAASLGTLGMISANQMLYAPVLLPVTADARTATVVSTRHGYVVSRCVGAHIETVNLTTLAVESRQPQICVAQSNAAHDVTGQLVLVIEGRPAPVLWECQRLASAASGFTGCIKLGILEDGAPAFEQRVANLGAMPLFLAAPEDMALLPRDS